MPGGLFTPTLAIGTMFGGLAGGLWLHLWPGGDVGAYALIGGAAMLGAAMQGPLSAIVMVLELMPRAAGLTVPILIAVATATVVARIAGAHSLYSVRLAQRWTDEGSPGTAAQSDPGLSRGCSRGCKTSGQCLPWRSDACRQRARPAWLADAQRGTARGRDGDGPTLLILAGAGTGKTTTLSARVAC